MTIAYYLGGRKPCQLMPQNQDRLSLVPNSSCGNVEAGIKTIVGTIPTDPAGPVETFANGELFNRGLRQDVTLPAAGLSRSSRETCR